MEGQSIKEAAAVSTPHPGVAIEQIKENSLAGIHHVLRKKTASTFNGVGRLVGLGAFSALTALSPMKEVKAGGLEDFAKSVGTSIVVGAVNQTGAPYGVSVRQSRTGQPEVVFDPNQAMRAQQEIAIQRILNSPTEFVFPQDVQSNLQSLGVRAERSGDTLTLFGSSPNAFSKRMTIYNPNGTKLRRAIISGSADVNRFYLDKISFNPHSRTESQEKFVISYDRNTESWDIQRLR